MDEYYEDYLNYFSKRLIKLRMAKGVSAREMGLAIGQSKSYIGALERKHSLPSMTVFLYICDYLGISPRDFFDEDVKYPEILSKVIDNLKQLDEKKLNDMNAIAEGLIGK